MSRRREREPPECVWVTPPAPDLECSVCSEVFTDPVTLACGHTFCRACAVSWFDSTAKRCPLGACPASAKSKPAKLPTQYALKSMVDALRVRCRFGLCEDERGGWMPDPSGCPAQLSRSEAAAHEASCEHASEACPFAGCGALRRRRDADAHDVLMAVAHARGERDARLSLEAHVHSERDARLDAIEASARGERDARLDALEAGVQARLETLEATARAQQALLDALGPRPAASVPAVAAEQALLAAVTPAAAGGGNAARAVTGAVRRATLQGSTCGLYACCWSPDGSMLVSGDGGGRLKLWDANTLECTATLIGHGRMILNCAWSPDGRTVASASTDKTVKLWNVATSTCEATLVHSAVATSCAYSPDGRSLATCCRDAFKVWDLVRCNFPRRRLTEAIGVATGAQTAARCLSVAMIAP
jgi:hypothetical protein